MDSNNHINKIDLQKVHAKLQSSVIGHKIIYLDTVPSTMDVAHSHAVDLTNDGLVILAEEQTSGRGRFNRNWVSPKYQNLYISILVRSESVALKYMSIAASLAVANAIEALTHLKVEMNWPNDLKVNGKKLAGILVEQVHSLENLSYGVIGVGLNVNKVTSEYQDIAQTATSIQTELGKAFSRELLLIKILEQLEVEQQLIQANISPVLQWKQKLVTLGQRVTFRDLQVEHTGEAVDVDNNGNLVMQLDDYSYITLASGELTSQDLAQPRQN